MGGPMSTFEFFFSFYGLILGLSVVELVRGAARMVDEGHRLKVGWLTPILAIFLALDVTTFWGTTWLLFREAPNSFVVFVLALIISGLFYLATYLTFPQELEDGQALDEHYWQRRRLILSSVVLANFLVFTIAMTLAAINDVAVPGLTLVGIGLFFTVGIAAILLPRGRLAVAGLILMLLVNIVTLVESSVSLVTDQMWTVKER